MHTCESVEWAIHTMATSESSTDVNTSGSSRLSPHVWLRVGHRVSLLTCKCERVIFTCESVSHPQMWIRLGHHVSLHTCEYERVIYTCKSVITNMCLRVSHPHMGIRVAHRVSLHTFAILVGHLHISIRHNKHVFSSESSTHVNTRWSYGHRVSLHTCEYEQLIYTCESVITNMCLRVSHPTAILQCEYELVIVSLSTHLNTSEPSTHVNQS